MDIIVGTAGHIDHGKTALVKALTGTDADRFPEEKQRGITIDIGFAELSLGDVRIGFVDVPGHERFVKNMLAGASGIDAVLLVIAADEGVMPQTREHFEICRLLETKTGLVVLTKKDLVDEELIELVKLETAELVENSFLEKAPVIAVSARTGEGLDELKNALAGLAGKIPARKNELVARLPIDRSFTVKGFGAVVTGTLVAGEIAEGSEMELLPAGKQVRVRGVQTYGKAVKRAAAGQRTAVNLGGIDHTEIERGMVLAEKDVLRPAYIFDAEIEVLKEAKRALRSRRRIRVHIGTIEALARISVLNEKGEIAPGEKDFVQIRLEKPVVCLPDERFIIRQYSPQTTIAGGRVLDNAAVKHKRKDAAAARKYLQELTGADNARRVRLYLESAGAGGLTFKDLQARSGWRKTVLQKALDENLEKRAAVKAEEVFIARTPFENLKAKTLSAIEDFHRKEPLKNGILRETLRERVFAYLAPEIFRAVLQNLEAEKKIVSEKDFVRAAAHNLELSGEEKILRRRLSEIYAKANLEVPKLEEALGEAVKNTGADTQHARKIFQLLLNSGEIVKVSDEFYFSKDALDNLKNQMREFAEKTEDRLIDVPAFKDLAGISRKYAIPLLEFFDRERVTRRAGDKRLIL
jgi:selenocysteine-specific elongation factor